MQKTRWAVIGLGVGRQHARELAVMPDAELVALCDRDAAVLTDACDEFPGAQAFGDQHELIHSGTIDAVVIATYDSDHGDAVVAALEQGLHVFAEKPVATSREQLVAIWEALNRRRDLHLTTNTLLRRSPRFAWLKSSISSGDFGDLFHVEGDYLYGRLGKLADGWRGRDPGYSVTLGGAVHVIDLLIWLTGQLPSRVIGIGSRKGLSTSPQFHTSGFRGDDFRMAMLEFDSGLTAKVSANFAGVLPHFHRVDIFGAEASFFHVPGSVSPGSSPSEGRLFVSREPSRACRTLDLPYPAVPKGVLLPTFNQVILGSGQPDITEQEALDVMAVCLAIDESVQVRGPVDVAYPRLTARLSQADVASGGTS